MEMLDRKVEEWGNFCSGPCANTYLDKNMRDSNLATRAADLFEYMQDVHGFRENEIGFAPHFTQHVNYGGDLTDEQFDMITNTPGLTTHILMKPYIPTDAVIEWQYTGGFSDRDHNTTTSNTAATNRQELDIGVNKQVPCDDVLASVMKTRPPDTDHHHRWDATHLKQPSMDAIEERLASLPPLPKTTGLYELYLQRKGGLEGPISDDETTATTTTGTRSRKKQLPSAVPPPPPPMNATTASFASLLTSNSSKKRKKTEKK